MFFWKLWVFSFLQILILTACVISTSSFCGMYFTTITYYIYPGGSISHTTYRTWWGMWWYNFYPQTPKIGFKWKSLNPKPFETYPVYISKNRGRQEKITGVYFFKRKFITSSGTELLWSKIVSFFMFYHNVAGSRYTYFKHSGKTNDTL